MASQVFIRCLLVAVFAVADTDLRLAAKINVNSAAVARPDLINEVGSKWVIEHRTVYGRRRVEVSSEQPGGFEIVINGGEPQPGGMLFSGL